MNATCNNTEGSFACYCNEGFNGNGTYCNGKYSVTPKYFCVFSLSGGTLSPPVSLCTMVLALRYSFLFVLWQFLLWKAIESYLCRVYILIITIVYLLLDTDECYSGDNDCDDSATCHNLIGSYNCSCKKGYSGDGFKCQGTTIFSLFL